MIDVAVDTLPGRELHHYLARAARLEPAKIMGADCYLLTRFADVRAFLSDLGTFPAGATYEMQVEPTVGRTFISMDGADHDAYRAMAMPAFRSRPAARFVDTELIPLAHEVIDRFAYEGRADLVASLTGVLPFWAISRKLGLPIGSEELQRRWALVLLSYPVAPQAALAAAAEVTAFLEPIVGERRREPQDDVLSQLTVQMSDEEVYSHVRLLYAVGATTTSDAMSSLLFHLLTQPGLYERAVAEPELRPWIVHELLRFEPAVANLPRLVNDGGTLGGRDLAPGTVVLASLAAANRDPDVFDDPDTFDPDRRQRDQITFGAGAKFCPGSHLATRQLGAALDVVLERLPGLRLIDAEPPSGAILRSSEKLLCTWGSGI